MNDEYDDGCLGRMKRRPLPKTEPLVDRTISRLFKRLDIVKEGVLYLRRWCLLRTRWGRLYLHRIPQPDMDRDLHDHPWDSIIWILWGGYTEEVRRSPSVPIYWMQKNGWGIRRMRAEHTHRISRHHRGVTWSLVLCGRHRRDWGFWTDKGWVKWTDYLAAGEEQ